MTPNTNPGSPQGLYGTELDGRNRTEDDRGDRPSESGGEPNRKDSCGEGSSEGSRGGDGVTGVLRKGEFTGVKVQKHRGTYVRVSDGTLVLLSSYIAGSSTDCDNNRKMYIN